MTERFTRKMIEVDVPLRAVTVEEEWAEYLKLAYPDGVGEKTKLQELRQAFLGGYCGLYRAIEKMGGDRDATQESFFRFLTNRGDEIKRLSRRWAEEVMYAHHLADPDTN